MEAIVLAGGFGTRLSTIVQDVPKPMAPVANRPFLEYILDELIDNGVTRVILAVHYKKECIMEHFGCRYRTAEILYSVEDVPLLTGGAVKRALRLCNESKVFIVNGDTYFHVPLARMVQAAAEMGKPVTIAIKQMRHFSRYGRVEFNNKGCITKFHEKEPCESGFINGGIYYLQRNILDNYPDKFSLESDCFPALLQTRDILAFISDGYFIDIGVPEDFYAAQSYFEEK